MKPKSDLRAEMCREYYDVLIVALRHVAYQCGYALAVHGSLNRDIDLIACPWRDSAPPAGYLAAQIQKATQVIIGFARTREVDPNPRAMPCGRLAWSFYLTHDDNGAYIDLSVMAKPEKAMEYTYTGEIAELKAQKAALIKALGTANALLEERRFQNELLKDGLAMSSPREYWPDPA